MLRRAWTGMLQLDRRLIRSRDRFRRWPEDVARRNPIATRRDWSEPRGIQWVIAFRSLFETWMIRSLPQLCGSRGGMPRPRSMGTRYVHGGGHSFVARVGLGQRGSAPSCLTRPGLDGGRSTHGDLGEEPEPVEICLGGLGLEDLGRRASVAVWIAVMMPGLFMAVALGVEAGGWAAAQVSVQRAADLSAIAGGINYVSTTNKQTAATFAARMAQLNGATGTATPSWNSGTNTLTDNMITAQVISGYATSTDTAMKVTVQRTVPATVSKVFNTTGSYTITGTGVAELVTSTTPPTGAAAGQPCLLALSTRGTISGAGSTYWTMPNCTVRSNGTVDVHGGGGPVDHGWYFRRRRGQHRHLDRHAPGGSIPAAARSRIRMRATPRCRSDFTAAAGADRGDKHLLRHDRRRARHRRSVYRQQQLQRHQYAAERRHVRDLERRHLHDVSGELWRVERAVRAGRIRSTCSRASICSAAPLL